MGTILPLLIKIQRNCPEAFVVLISFTGLSLSFLSNKLNIFTFSLLKKILQQLTARSEAKGTACGGVFRTFSV